MPGLRKKFGAPGKAAGIPRICDIIAINNAKGGT